MDRAVPPADGGGDWGSTTGEVAETDVDAVSPDDAENSQSSNVSRFRGKIPVREKPDIAMFGVDAFI